MGEAFGLPKASRKAIDIIVIPFLSGLRSACCSHLREEQKKQGFFYRHIDPHVHPKDEAWLKISFSLGRSSNNVHFLPIRVNLIFFSFLCLPRFVFIFFFFFVNFSFSFWSSQQNPPRLVFNSFSNWFNSDSKSMSKEASTTVAGLVCTSGIWDRRSSKIKYKRKTDLRSNNIIEHYLIDYEPQYI